MKVTLKVLVFLAILIFAITGCIVYYVDDIIYDYGLTGNWSAQSTSLSNNTLRIENKVGASITNVKYYVGATEPNWSTISNTLITESAPLINNASIDFTIGNGSQIDIGSATATSIWVRVASGSDYLVGSFYFDSNANKWWLTVYKKV